jgi:outer membrane receptor protein involved in Fe transport
MGLRSGLGKIRYNFSDNTYGVLTVTDEADWRDQSGLISNPETVFLAGPGVTLSKDPLGYPYFFVFPMNFVWNTDPKYAFDLHTALAGGSLVARYYDNWINRWVDGNSAPSFDCCFLQKSIDHLAGELLTWEKPFGNQNITLAVGGNGDNFQYGSQFNFEKPVTASQITPTTGSQIERTVLLRDDDDISAKFRATFAGYYSDYNDLNVKRFDPRFAVVNRPDENTAIRFSVGTGFAPPRLSDIVSPLDLSVFTSTTGPNCTSSNFFCNATSGNPNIKPETGTGYDLGFERTFGAQGDLSIDLYRTDLKSHIFYGILPAPPGLLFSDGVTPVLGIQEPINLAGSVYTGIEASGALPVTRFFTAHAYYNTQASYPTGVDLMTEQTLGDVVNNQQYLGVPLHKIGWSMSFQNGANLTAFFGADWFGPNNSYNVPQFWQYNAGASVPYGPDTSLHVAWRNIFNKNATIFETFGGGVPYPSIAGFGGCSSACTYTTSAYSSPPHTLTVTIDHRWGSLR